MILRLFDWLCVAVIFVVFTIATSELMRLGMYPPAALNAAIGCVTLYAAILAAQD